ncbi:hypothetical protein NHX12_007883 [Muraenolepis orangiensis]|uniref:Uncharacterized protein n=1 Tax=Muraenolepis orangiensis TaxID=630683 RepID=A0A9Q0DSA2_9TELE|nr:hypothetical protein NHX12_007883 [Muraenolepis orangiensis]
MDVSIAVSLIRGQMGTVVERAVNGAVETVLAEMLRIVGVKFEELKAQVAALQRDKVTVQREKVLKEKENDKIRAMLRYTELKLKYYRQGVEEEIQHRATTSSHPSSQHTSPSSTARSLEPPLAGETVPSSSSLSKTESENCHGHDNELAVSGFSAQTDVFSAPGESFGEIQCFGAEDKILGMGENLPYRGLAGSCLDPGGVPSLEDPLGGFLSSTPKIAQDRHHAEYETSIHEKNNFCLVCGKPQVKLARHLKVHKGHPEIAMVLSLKPSCKNRKVLLEQLRNRGNFLHNSRVVAGGAGMLKVKRRPKEGRARSYGCCQFCHGSFVSTDLWRHVMRCPLGVAGSSLPALLAHVPPRQAVRPWPKDPRLYEEYKLRRNELQRRSINRRREREKSLPQPLLADLVRKLTLTLTLSPTAARGPGGVIPSIRALPTQTTSFMGNNMMPGNSNMLPGNSNMLPGNSNMMPGNSNMLPGNSNMMPGNSNMMPGNSNMMPGNSNMMPGNGNMMPSNNMLPSHCFPAYISSSSSVFLGRTNMAVQHAVTSTSPQAPVSQSQHSSSLIDGHLFQ